MSSTTITLTFRTTITNEWKKRRRRRWRRREKTMRGKMDICTMRTGSDHLQATKHSPAQEVAQVNYVEWILTTLLSSFTRSSSSLSLPCDKHKSLEFLNVLLPSTSSDARASFLFILITQAFVLWMLTGWRMCFLTTTSLISFFLTVAVDYA
jgi:hypothetical protein